VESTSEINPWQELPQRAPFVLEIDSARVEAHNRRQRADSYRYDLSLLPEPFFGDPCASVVFLALNPGWNPANGAEHGIETFAQSARLSLAHRLKPYPFLHLQTTPSGVGSLWWRRVMSRLIRDAGFDAVAKGVMCVQFFPYHSVKFRSSGVAIPSQRYSFSLVRKAIERDAEIVVMRSWRLWSLAIPELIDYRRLHIVRNPRNPAISVPNLPEGYERIVGRLTV
jgi:hypothetical protein